MKKHLILTLYLGLPLVLIVLIDDPKLLITASLYFALSYAFYPDFLKWLQNKELKIK